MLDGSYRIGVALAGLRLGFAGENLTMRCPVFTVHITNGIAAKRVSEQNE